MLLEVGSRPSRVQALAEQGVVLPERLLALTELTGQSEAGLEDLDEAFYLHLLAATGTGSSTRPSWPARSIVRRVERATGTPRPLPPGQVPPEPAAAPAPGDRPSPCTASPGCSPPWTSCSLGAVPPTHEVLNQPPPLAGYDLYDADPVLGGGAAPRGAGWAAKASGPSASWPAPRRRSPGARPPTPARRSCAPTTATAAGSTRSSSTRPGTGCWARRWPTACTPPPGATRAGRPGGQGGRVLPLDQVEAGHGCPVSMTFAAVPALRASPELAEVWEPKLTALAYDPVLAPVAAGRGRCAAWP